MCKIVQMSWFSTATHYVGHIVDSRTLSVCSITVFSDQVIFVCFHHASIQLLLHPLFGRASPPTTEKE